MNIISINNNIISAKHKKWSIVINEKEKEFLSFAESLINFEDVKILKVLKDSKRSYVAIAEFNNKKVIIKTPRMKHELFRMRILTMFCKGESFSVFYNIKKIRDKGFENIFEPILAMDIRKNGLVQNSWFVYYYEEGKKCEKKNYKKLINTLERFHKLGYRHSDANIANFLINKNDEVILIDCRGKKNFLGKIGEYIDFIALEKSGNMIADYYNFDKNKYIYKLTKAHIENILDLRQISNAIRRILKRMIKVWRK